MKNNNKLALFGGPKTFKEKVIITNTIGKEEISAVNAVMKSGVLSKFLGEYDSDFFGGPKVLEFEDKICKFFKVKHAITVNPWSSGLTVAVGAIGIEPGDEVIVPTWTMTASATAILHWNAIPVFADIELDTFNVDPKSIKKNITKRTKAIMSVDIFGHSANMIEILKIAKKYNLKVISDTAQAICSKYHGKYSGTLSDIGGFSFNYHKHIHTGEGGVLITNDDKLALKMKMIRNHAEAVVSDFKIKNISNMIGNNFRMGEIEAAIGICQLRKLKKIVLSKQKQANLLIKGLKNLKGLRLPKTLKGCTHSYYAFPMLVNEKITGVTRDKIYDALIAEGVPALAKDYSKLHLLPIYQKKIAYGTKGYPWTGDNYKGKVNYKKGICPNAEFISEKSYINFGICLYELNNKKIDKIIDSFHKVWSNLDKLKSK